MLYCVICIDENAQVCTTTIVFRRHRWWFRLIKNWAWFINHVAGDSASPSVLRMILICCISCIEFDGWFQGGLLEAPLYPLKPGASRGPPGLSGGPGPLVIRPLYRMLLTLTKNTSWQLHRGSFKRTLEFLRATSVILGWRSNEWRENMRTNNLLSAWCNKSETLTFLW